MTTRTAKATTRPFLSFANKHIPAIDQTLDTLLNKRPARVANDHLLLEAMRYSTLLPGKRVRPLLVLASCEACGGRVKMALPAAAALEMVHTFSLIHDDLPALDNDNLRRGWPTNHKVHGEAQAILAGDGLLAHSFAIITKHLPPELAGRCCQELAEATGPYGMISGESIDVAGFTAPPTAHELAHLNGLKTGRLIEASAIIGGLIGNADQTRLKRLRQYAAFLGQIFQLTDDLLDLLGSEQVVGKAVNKDTKKGKITIATLMGIKECQREIDRLYLEAIRQSRFFTKHHILTSLVEFVRNRRH